MSSYSIPCNCEDLLAYSALHGVLKMQYRKDLFIIVLVLEINKNSRGLIHCLESSPNYSGRGLR